MIVSHQLKFIYVAVSKTGTTSIEKYLGNFNEVTVPKHVSLSNLKRLTGIEHQSYFKFCFTRNPWDRMVSFYFQLQKPINLETTGRRRKYELTNKYSFKDYIKIERKENPKFLDEASIKAFIGDENGQIGVDFIGKYENLQSDFNKVCELLKIPKTKLPRINVSKRKHYSYYYDEESKEIIATGLKYDIEQGAYQFEKAK